MEDNIRMLNEINKVMEMGIISIDNVLEYKDLENVDKLRRYLKKQKKEYELIKEEVLMFLEKSNVKPQGISALLKLNTKVSMKMKIMKNSSESNVAKLFMKGTNMGIISMTEKINCNKLIDKNIKKLAIRSRETLENNYNNLKKFI